MREGAGQKRRNWASSGRNRAPGIFVVATHAVVVAFCLSDAFDPSPRTTQPVVPPGAHHRVAVSGGDRALRPGALGPTLILVFRAWVRLRRLAIRFEGAGRQGARLPACRGPVARLPGSAFCRARYRLPARPQTLSAAAPVRRPLRRVPETVAYGGQGEHLPADPRMTALLAASPQAGRILRPLCHMLAIKPPPALAAPPRAKRLAAPAAAIPAPDPSRAVSRPVVSLAGCRRTCRRALPRAGVALGQAEPYADPPLGLPAPA